MKQEKKYALTHRISVEPFMSDAKRSFSSPTLSPDGKWILMVGNSEYQFNGKSYPNTDIFVCSVDGTNLTQLTYHPANDLSPQGLQIHTTHMLHADRLHYTDCHILVKLRMK